MSGDFFHGVSEAARGRYAIEAVIGKGAYGMVARVKDTETGELRAVKRIKPLFRNTRNALCILREIRLLRRFSHANIVTLHAVLRPEGQEFDALFMVMDYMDRHDLFRSFIQPPRQIERSTLQSVMAQVLAGLAHVHALGGIHRDLKPENVLIDAHGTIKLCDFNLSRSVDGAGNGLTLPSVGSERDSLAGGDTMEQQSARDEQLPPLQPLPPQPPQPPQPQPQPQLIARQMTDHVCSRWYRAPELLLQLPYSTAVDLWSVGGIYFEVAARPELLGTPVAPPLAKSRP